MLRIRTIAQTTIATILIASCATFVSAQTSIMVEFEVNHGQTGTGFAPLAGVFHDGSFNVFDPGMMARPGLESLAEIGNPTAFLNEAQSLVPTANSGGTDGQIGGSNRPLSRSFTVDVDSGNTNFSYASMFLPSNDWFVSNPGGGSLDISSLLGAGVGSSIAINVGTIYDAGTELEDFTRGGGTGTDPFNLVPRLSDADGGNPDDQMDNVSLVPRVAGQNLFTNFVNPNNEPIDRFIGASDPSNSLGTVTLTVVPEPSSISLGLFAMLGLAGLTRRRRRK